MSKDSILHALGGAAMALPWALLPRSTRRGRLFWIDLWAWEREVAQHDPDLTPHQIEEAKAWGVGARRVLRLKGEPYPSLPYPA